MTSPSLFFVVKNTTNQHALWPDHLPVPAGWTHEGYSGTEADCMTHIDQVWNDMTPLVKSPLPEGATQ
ncbi:MAG: MbtH family NRPS accessory protein [Aliishimia sp.]